MEFTEEQLDQYIALYKQEFGEEVSRVEAQQGMLSLIRLIGLSTPVIPTDEENIVSERN
ncbi:MAG: hypothetical protein ACOYMZ_03465 [Minisyncoccia bacterium]